jgi:hypothetical protein
MGRKEAIRGARRWNQGLGRSPFRLSATVALDSCSTVFFFFFFFFFFSGYVFLSLSLFQ